ncbi:MAG: RNA polymerase sigma-54 factor [Verrucomicrobia bacterium]|nr:MAG: RNA polymerase sigma-54 factor [Verrucomicrobiota bacterium]
MSQGMDLSQQLSLQQTLAPQLQHSLALLQAPALELRALINQELAQNPVLEEAPAVTADPDDGEVPSAGDRADNPEAASDSGEGGNGEPVDDLQAELERLVQMDEEWREYFSQTQVPLRSREVEQEKREYMMNSLTSETSLQEHLLDQVRLGDFSDEDRRVAELIVGNIDDHGYLQASVHELVLATGEDADRVRRVLRYIQQNFHPPGVAARDLRECLMIQLERAGRTDSLEYKILRDHMKLLARRRLPELARATGRPLWVVQEAVERIGQLEPRPGRAFSSGEGAYVVPELTIEKVNGEYQVFLHNDHLPRIRISNTYKDLLAAARTSPEVRSYLREKIRSGRFLIRSLHQRQETLRRVAEEIVRRQKDFFDHGVSHLKPMTLAEVAEAVGLHETTVSRAVSGKYAQTPQGLIELKSLFTTGVSTEDGQRVSSRTVKEIIADLVAHEDPHNPLSDDALVQALRERGIQMARRTVAKYRSELNILPSHLRRVY